MENKQLLKVVQSIEALLQEVLREIRRTRNDRMSIAPGVGCTVSRFEEPSANVHLGHGYISGAANWRPLLQSQNA